MKPYIKVMNDDWHQGGQRVKYDYDQDQKCYFLEFQYDFQQANSDVYFATLPPYSYTELNGFLEIIKDMSP